MVKASTWKSSGGPSFGLHRHKMSTPPATASTTNGSPRALHVGYRRSKLVNSITTGSVPLPPLPIEWSLSLSAFCQPGRFRHFVPANRYPIYMDLLVDFNAPHCR